MFLKNGIRFKIHLIKIGLLLFSFTMFQYPITVVAKDLQPLYDSASPKVTNKGSIFRSAKFSGTAFLQITDTKRAVQGKLGLKVAPDHRMYLVGRTTVNNSGSAANRYGVGYNWRIAKRYSLDFNTMNIQNSAGKTFTHYGLGLLYRIPTKPFKSAVRVGYKSTENISALTNVNFSISKNALYLGESLLRISGSVRWRQKEFSSGNTVEGVGGSVGMNLQLKSKAGLHLLHNIGDDISRELTSVAGTYSTRVAGKTMLLRFGVDSRDTALFMFHTGLN